LLSTETCRGPKLLEPNGVSGRVKWSVGFTVLGRPAHLPGDVELYAIGRQTSSILINTHHHNAMLMTACPDQYRDKRGWPSLQLRTHGMGSFAVHLFSYSFAYSLTRCRADGFTLFLKLRARRPCTVHSLVVKRSGSIVRISQVFAGRPRLSLLSSLKMVTATSPP